MKFRMIFALLLLLMTGLAACSSSSEGAPMQAKRPEKPAAPEDDFRSDAPVLVGSTGRPQVIEIFSRF